MINSGPVPPAAGPRSAGMFVVALYVAPIRASLTIPGRLSPRLVMALLAEKGIVPPSPKYDPRG